MENQVLGYKSPLFGRRTAQLRIVPFSFFETAKYFKKFNAFDLMTIYGITGGIPHYLAQMDENMSVDENIIKNFFDPSSFLFEEPLNLLKQEVRESGLYNAIICAIAAGSTRSAEICSKIKVDSSVFATYATNLISLGIVRKETPITENSSKKTIYTVDDGMFRFWHRFIPDNLATISCGMGERAFRRIAPLIPAFLSNTFENVCSQYLWELNKNEETPFSFSKLGRWWGNNPIKKEEAEIDILAFADKASAIFAECKWTNEKVETNVLRTLVERSHILDFNDRYYYIFAKNGFSKNIRNTKNVKYVSLEEIWTACHL
jgi:AAA+ ATPase superfamily predicted ATPase